MAKLGGQISLDAVQIDFDPASRKMAAGHGSVVAFAGEAGSIQYGFAELRARDVTGQLDTTYWTAASATALEPWLRGRHGVDIRASALEAPRGLLISRSADGAAEIRAPELVLREVQVSLPNLLELGGRGGAPRTSTSRLRQERLRFLDDLVGTIRLTIKVELDLPVVGKRTLDQSLSQVVVAGSIDYRQLEQNLNWLEGKFLDLGVEEHRLAIGWKVPVISPSSKDLISWELDDDAAALAATGRVPLRSLLDAVIPATTPSDPATKKRRLLRSLSLDGIAVEMSLPAPHAIAVGGGTVQLGGEGAAGIVGLAVQGKVAHPSTPGALRGSIGAVDATVKDVTVGGVAITADRIHLDNVDTLELAFDGLRPTALTARINRIVLSNLSLVIRPRFAED